MSTEHRTFIDFTLREDRPCCRCDKDYGLGVCFYGIIEDEYEDEDTYLLYCFDCAQEIIKEAVVTTDKGFDELFKLP